MIDAQVPEFVTLGIVRASPTDFLRLVALPVFGWAAYRDVKTRRVPNETWVPLALLGVALLAVDAWAATGATLASFDQFVLRAGLGIGLVVPLAYLFWRIGGFGGADAKALMVLALLFPTFPAYLFLPPLSDPIGSLPLEPTPVGIFSFTVLTNAVLVGGAYPVAVTTRNALAGRFDRVMFVGRPVPVTEVTDTYGRLLETPGGTTRRGLDLDALRMYLQWRGITLAELRADPDRYRDPDSLPAEPNPPGDGAITDGGRPDDDAPTEDDGRSAASDGANADAGEDGNRPGDGDKRSTEDDHLDADPGEGEPGSAGDGPTESTDRRGDEDQRDADPVGDGHEDPWGAEAFLEDVGGAYGTSPATLREGLEVLVESDDVWVSPGLPFLVPLFLGLVVAFVYGDVLFGLLTATGVV